MRFRLRCACSSFLCCNALPGCGLLDSAVLMATEPSFGVLLLVPSKLLRGVIPP